MKENIALKVTDKDNVATIFADDITDGSRVTVLDKRGERQEYTVKGTVPYGHKIALAPIKKGELIIKYGEEIGIATHEIWTVCAAGATGTRRRAEPWNLWDMCARTARWAPGIWWR